MARRKPIRREAVVHYPAHLFEPEELLTFIELRPFTRRWQESALNDMDLLGLQIALMMRPRAGATIQGTGGLRKMRFAPIRASAGKSGGLRVCYAYFPLVAAIVLAVVYAKNEKDNLNQNDKAVLRNAIQRIERLLMSRPYRLSPNPDERDM